MLFFDRSLKERGQSEVRGACDGRESNPIHAPQACLGLKHGRQLEAGEGRGRPLTSTQSLPDIFGSSWIASRESCFGSRGRLNRAAAIPGGGSAAAQGEVSESE